MEDTEITEFNSISVFSVSLRGENFLLCVSVPLW